MPLGRAPAPGRPVAAHSVLYLLGWVRTRMASRMVRVWEFGRLFGKIKYVQTRRRFEKN